MSQRLKKRIYEILEKTAPEDRVGRAFQIFIMTLILINVVAIILDTVEWLSNRYSTYFYGLEVFSVAIFTVEYLLRLWSCTSDTNYKHPLWGRLRFGVKPLVIVDLLAILPFYLPMLITIDLRFIRILRLFRLFRVFKLGRYTESLSIMVAVFKSKKEEMAITAFTILVLLMLASSAMYYAEHDAQPETFSSIPAAMWWGVVTLATVGYGDVYPITGFGRFLGAIVAILGIGIFALPAGILASAFAEEIRNRRRKAKTCPHCGQDIDD